MPDPIRPEDHSIDGVPPLPACRRVFSDRGGDIRDDALAEAIHQTFERDAAELETPPSMRDGDSRWNMPAYRNTEIDRLARLIVDGEYRRRQAEGGRDE